ncbi:hypothetical protein FisN_5Hh252 [Fistulifera solaris]|uniref:Uncharacterized protein n=1 Tax=Fistulifera solaris TaxID=1519565 RepID=A0A1Z5JSF6_FISSO|nr:hypothetical protein FisN_5Hh252 [Fistulifera solaris]|eukprot:GAX16879.1 hypothetical protein FisN_5Hh252 [Fistulifera solaris]
MTSTKRCNKVATSHSKRLLSGSLPIKKRTFQPFKMAGAPLHLHGAPDSDVVTSERKIVTAVSRDDDDAFLHRQSKSSVTSIHNHFLEVKLQGHCLEFESGKESSQGLPKSAFQAQQFSTLSTTPQDRRYTGSTNETQCAATTTRGRSCAYIAVGESKYCNMHADYDTNPPPRRTVSKQKSRSRARKQAKKQILDAADDIVVHTGRPPSAASSLSGNSVDSSAANQDVLDASSRNVPIIDAAHPCALLSTLSTDHWYRTAVRVGTGPFKGRTGHVEKWGNGWVSVHIAGVGSHNRRSFELYLYSNEEVSAFDEMKCERDRTSIHQQQTTCTVVGNTQCISPIVITPRPIVASQNIEAPSSLKRSSSIGIYSLGKEPTKECNVVTPPTQRRRLISETFSIPSLTSSVGAVDEGNVPVTIYDTPVRERSRRLVHKPSRFQETELLKNIHGSRKRARSRGDEEDTEKRSRYGFFI